ncbi:MAG: ATP-binding protein [Candidatus Aquicultor sp.]
MHSIQALEGTVELTVPAESQYLASIRQLTSDAAHSASFDDDDTNDLILAVVEAATNAVRHSRSDRILISFLIGAGEITARILDTGCGFKFHGRKCKFPSIEKPGGRGIPLMHNLVDRFEVESRAGSGTEVILVKKASRSYLKTASPR